MRALVKLLVGLAVLWSGAWFLASYGTERAVEGWLQDRRAEGWQAEAQVATAGFPAGLELTLTDPALADPETGLAWSAPWARFHADAWAPTAITATLPSEQTLASPFGRTRITARAMEAGLDVAPSPKLALRAMSARLEDLSLDGPGAMRSTLASGRLDTARVEGDPLVHDILFEARDLTPARRLLDRFDPGGLLPAAIDILSLDARIAFDAPWDLDAIEVRRPQPRRIELNRSHARWGEMELELAGTLDVSADGVPDGRITVRAMNWREMVRVASAAGAIPEGIVPTVERGLELLAGLGGNPATIDAPLGFRNGLVSLGPVPLGPAPRLRLR